MNRIPNGAREPIGPLTLAGLVVIVIDAAILRLSALGRESAWLDEVLSVTFSTGDPAAIVARLQPHHLPVFFWLTSPFLAPAASEAWLRLPDAIVGIALVPVVFLIGVELGRVRVGLTAAALVAVSTYQINYSREIRMYALMAFLSLLGTWAVVRLGRGGRRPAAWAVLGLASLLNLYTSPFAIFMVAIHWVAVGILAWREHDLRRPFVCFAVLVALAYMPAVLHMLPMVTGSAKVVQGSTTDYTQLWTLLSVSFSHFAGLIPGLVVLLVLGSLLGFAIAWRQCRAFALIAVASFVVPVVSLYFSKPGHSFNPRYLIYAQPHLVLLTAVALVWLWDQTVKRLASPAHFLDLFGPAAVGVILVVGITDVTPGHELVGRREDWRGIARTLLDNVHDGDLVVIEPFYEDNALLYHLDRLSPAGKRLQLTQKSSPSWYGMYHRATWSVAAPEEFRGPTITVIGVVKHEHLDQLPAVPGDVWLITSSLPERFRERFQAVSGMAPVKSFAEPDPQADPRSTRVLYRRNRQPEPGSGLKH